MKKLLIKLAYMKFIVTFGDIIRIESAHVQNLDARRNSRFGGCELG